MTTNHTDTISLNDSDPGAEYFVEDHDDVHCVHGTYIGYPGGPDYLCGWCEDGVSLTEYRDAVAAQRERSWRNAARTGLISDSVAPLLTFRHVWGPDRWREFLADVVFDELDETISSASVDELTAYMDSDRTYR